MPEASSSKLFCFNLEAVISLDAMTVDCAWAAAKQLWPEAVVANAQVYRRHMSQVVLDATWAQLLAGVPGSGLRIG